MIAVESPPDIFYPSEDDEPLAETQQHALAILMAFSALSLYLKDRQAVVFADQFFYYSKGNPAARVAPDLMVVFDIPVQLYRSYKLWDYGSIPALIVEVTSENTKLKDLNLKTKLYESIGVQEYWLFDPYGDWIEGQLQGYQLSAFGTYEPITDYCCRVLGLHLSADGHLINFHRLDNGQKLLLPEELSVAKQFAERQVKRERQQRQQAEQQAKREQQQRQQAEQQATREQRQRQQAEQQARKAEQQAEAERQRADRLAQKLKDLGIDID